MNVGIMCAGLGRCACMCVRANDNYKLMCPLCGERLFESAIRLSRLVSSRSEEFTYLEVLGSWSASRRMSRGLN